MTVLYIVLGLIALFVGILVVNAIRFTPHTMEPVEMEVLPVNRDRVIKNMVDLIRCKTISYHEKEKMDEEEYQKLYKLIEERYPLIHQHCTREFIGDTGILFHWQGRTSLEPIVCMSHYDVVPVNEELWTKPAFDGIVEDGYIWGRGTLDTKGTFCSILEAVELLLSEGIVPNQDVYLSFSGDEEVAGTSCPAIVSELERRGIKPAMVLDEGGAVVEGAFPGVSAECALIGIGEKGLQNLDFILTSKGGHTATPPPQTTLGEMAKTIIKIEKTPFPVHFTSPVLQMFDILGRHSSFAYRLLFGNLWCFKPLLAFICQKSGGELNAMVRTTCAITRMEGSDAYNVLSPNVKMGANLRLLETENVNSTIAYLNRVIGNPNIIIQQATGSNPSIISDTKCKEWKELTQVIHATWPKAIISPYLMMAASDSRHYCRITDHVYRFSAMKLSKEERGMIHGHDERIPIDTLIKTVEFYVRLLKR